MQGTNFKTIEQWFSEIEQGQLVLPRFQRHPAWKDNQVAGLFENILRKPSLPIGVLLTLDVGDEQPFHYRPIDGAPKAAKHPRMHLLDGQQRMTAVWKALTNGFADRLFFVNTDPDEAEEENQENDDSALHVTVEKYKTSERNGKKYPVWAHSALKSAEYGLVPMSILRPGNTGEKAAKAWIKEAGDGDMDDTIFWNDKVTFLRAQIANFPIPYLELGKDTSQSTALNVFINMNTSSTPLKAYDIVVAQHEGATGESLHQKMNDLLDEAPMLKDFGNPEDYMLSVAALLMDKPPIKKSFLEADFGEQLEVVWPKLRNGFRRGMKFLEEQCVFSNKFVPADAAVNLALALWGDVSEASGDAEGNARELITNAFWRGCLSNRYEKTSATRTYADYKDLRPMLNGRLDLKSCKLFDDESTTLPKLDDILKAGWPTRKERLPRSILALSLMNGGKDFADDSKATRDSVLKREYHHIFPVQVLGGDRGDENVNRALNCALITWKTNRTISAKTPKDYLLKRTEASHLGEEKIKKRLKSHLIPFKSLSKNDYSAFLEKRAKLIQKQIDSLLTMKP